MFIFRKIILSLPVLLLFILCSNNTASAQQTIFNVPSADLVEKNMVFYQHQSSFSNKFGAFDNNFVYGIGKNTELDLTLYDIGTKNVRGEVLGVGFKSVIPLNEKTETKFTIGHLIPIGLRKPGVGGYTYSHLSTVIPKLKTRVTAGVTVATTTIFDRDVVSFIGGIEHPITKRLWFAADWYSGKHSNGFFIPGFYYYLSQKTIISGAFRIRNNKENGYNGFIIELSKFF